jgi:hypothetical protein
VTELPGLDAAYRALAAGHPRVLANATPLAYIVVATNPHEVNRLKGRPPRAGRLRSCASSPTARWTYTAPAPTTRDALGVGRRIDVEGQPADQVP